MSESWKLSGKSISLPKSSKPSESGTWKFSERPGGGWIAESSSGERKRFQLFHKRTALDAHLHGRIFHGELMHAQRESRDGGVQSDADLVAQFPGKVRKILVQENQKVQAKEPLVLVEAMKMEFVIRAPCSGRVGKILVQEGQQLSPGDRFLDFEADQEKE